MKYRTMADLIIMTGVILAGAGVILKLSGATIPLLPGDILLRKEHMTVYFPIATGIVISIVLTLILNAFR